MKIAIAITHECVCSSRPGPLIAVYYFTTNIYMMSCLSNGPEDE